MKRFACIELLQIHERASFYVVRFRDDSESEFEKFIAKFESRPGFEKSVEALVYWMDTIGKNGALNRYFRLEGGKVKAVPVERSRLRLYCYHLNETLLIWSGGGHKTSATYEEDPILAFQVSVIRQIGYQLIRRMNQGAVIFEGQQLSGNLEFEIEL